VEKTIDEGSKKGITAPCPDCRRAVLGAAELVGFGEMEWNTRCHNPKCRIRLHIKAEQKIKTKITITKILVVLITLVGIYQLITLRALEQSFAYLIETYGFKVPE